MSARIYVLPTPRLSSKASIRAAIDENRAQLLPLLPGKVASQAERQSLVIALELDALWCGELAADPFRSNRDRARLRRLARRLRRDAAALTPKPGRF